MDFTNLFIVHVLHLIVRTLRRMKFIYSPIIAPDEKKNSLFSSFVEAVLATTERRAMILLLWFLLMIQHTHLQNSKIEKVIIVVIIVVHFAIYACIVSRQKKYHEEWQDNIPKVQ